MSILEKHKRRVPPGVCAVFFKLSGDAVEVSMLLPSGRLPTNRIPDHVALAAEAIRHCKELMDSEDPLDTPSEESLERSADGSPGAVSG